VISRVRGWEIFAPDFAKAATPVIQPHLKAFVSERLLDDDVGRAVSVDIQGRYCEGSFVRFEGEASIFPTREVKLYCPEAALRPKLAVIDEDSAIGFVVTVEIGSGERLTERHREIRWRREIRPRQRTFEPILRPKGRSQSQRNDSDLEIQRSRLHFVQLSNIDSRKRISKNFRVSAEASFHGIIPRQVQITARPYPNEESFTLSIAQ
jgi:hypothetical protein